MKVCYFGTYSKSDGYPRNRVLIKGLRKQEIEVIECHVDLWEDSSDKTGGINKRFSFLRKVFRMLYAQLLLARHLLKVKHFDILIVGSIGHIEVFLVKIFTVLKKKPLVFDAFISLYSTIVRDRKLVRPHTVLAKILYFVDRYSCKLADLVLLDTNAQIYYFKEQFNLPAKKFQRVFVSTDTDVFKPKEYKENQHQFTVLFFGSFIPLHGIEHIIKAAKFLEKEKEIQFCIIGKGQEEEKVKRMHKELQLNNVTFIWDWISEKELAEHIAKSDICLGIFGNTEKAKRVIPCKIYNCLAMKKAVITARTPAITELLTDGINVILAGPENPEDLAEKIKFAKNNPSITEHIGVEGYKSFVQNASIEVTGKTLLNQISFFESGF